MGEPRVKRSRGPASAMTEYTYRKKALSFLKRDFQNRCAYCLRHLSDEHINQSHVEHFDSALKDRRRHRYSNLMLACSACNLSKLAKAVFDPKEPIRRLLNCTVENEFPEHVVENESSEWVAKTPAGDYHIRAVDLNEPAHVRRRSRRRAVFSELLKLETSAIRYKGSIQPDALNTLLSTLSELRDQLRTAIPIPTEKGLLILKLVRPDV